MSVQIIFKMPSVAVQRQVGSVVIKHGQLDHVRRLAIKRMLGISIHDPAYEAETKGMSAELDSKIKKRLKTSKLDLSQQAELLRLVRRARRVTHIRNKLVHSVWACEYRKALMLRDGTRKPESIPPITTLKQHVADIDDVRNQLNKLTKALL
jgi:hypothetical protein